MKNIVWLASYPKSGNTWARIFLTNLVHGDEGAANINSLLSSSANARSLFDRELGFSSANLTLAELENLRPDVYTSLASEANELLFFKAHNSFTYTTDGRPSFPCETTKCALYFVRNPLDVCVSFAHHCGHNNYDKIVADMRDTKCALCTKKRGIEKEVDCLMNSWSNHVLSWKNAPLHNKIHIIRYEDMILKPLESFTKIAEAVGVSDTKRIEKAIQFSSFDLLRKQEQEEGFREKIPGVREFFRKGEIGSWRDELSLGQVDAIIQDHKAVMFELGYITANGEVSDGL